MSCIFCDIVDKKIPSLIVGENKGAIAFLDVNPISDGHVIVIPRSHYRNLSHCPQLDLNYVMELVKEISSKLLDSKLRPWGINYLSNEGNVAGQEVMHFHIHVIPKYGKNEGLKLSIGTRCVEDVNSVYDILQKAKIKTY
jgi:histidine triad (HIT) family protein